MIRYSRFVFCPRCAGRGIEPFRENGMKCRECGFLYFQNCAAAVSAIIEFPVGILLVKRNSPPKRGALDLPGGFLDYGETFEEALARELREELDLQITDLRYFASSPNRYKYREVTYFSAEACFLCRPASGLKIQVNDEVSGVTIVSPRDIDMDKIGFESARRLIRLYKSLWQREKKSPSSRRKTGSGL
ncbi:MAG TPA: NUDIX domain-containing protein [Thermodesulfobacteriota bacterium]|nr:NUDIX domain-containing protein [Thermodesulfobacteriota bacterium]